MRHVRSVAAALPLAALVWVLTGVGAIRLGDALGSLRFGAAMVLPDAYLASSNRHLDGLVAAGVLIAAGLAYAVLLRVTPTGRGVAGVAYLAVSAWAMVDPAGFERSFPSGIGGFERAAQAPAWGYAMLLAAPMLLTLVRARARGSVLTGVGLGALVWVEAGIGIHALGNAVGTTALGEALVLSYENERPVPGNRLLDSVASVVFLLAAGGLVRLLIDGTRLRAALAVVGGVFVAVSLWAMTFPESYGTAVGVHWLQAPAWGYALLLAIPLLGAAAWPGAPRPEPTAP